MSQTPPRLVTSREDVDRLERRILECHDEAMLRITMDDGSVFEGTVSVRPTVEAFRNAAGDEGHNALLRLDDLEDPAVPHYIWLDGVRSIERLGTA